MTPVTVPVGVAAPTTDCQLQTSDIRPPTSDLHVHDYSGSDVGGRKPGVILTVSRPAIIKVLDLAVRFGVRLAARS